MNEVNNLIDELLGEMETRRQEYIKADKLKEPLVGMFWYVNNKLLNETKPAKECIIKGVPKIQYPRTHQDEWLNYVRDYPELLGSYHRLGKSLGEERDSFTYPPRGRVSGIIDSTGEVTYVLFIPPKLNNPSFINKIKEVYNLEHLLVKPDSLHYGTEFSGDTEKDFEGKLGKTIVQS